MWHCVVVMKALIWVAGLTCVLVSGLMPVYAIRGTVPSQQTSHPAGGADCELGVWTTNCSWFITPATGAAAAGTFDLPTYDVDLQQSEGIAQAVEALYTITLVLGVITLVWQVGEARLQCKRGCCDWALHILTALSGIVYSVLAWQFGRNFWVTFSMPDKGAPWGYFQLNVQASNEFFSLHGKPGIMVAATGTVLLVGCVIFRYFDAPAYPKERQPVVSPVNTAAYHTDATANRPHFVVAPLFAFVGLTCVLVSGLTPAYAIRGRVGASRQGEQASADCELGVWRTKCSWYIGASRSINGSSDILTYDVPLQQSACIVPAMEGVYTLTLLFGITAMVWQVVLAVVPESACLQAKAHGWHGCEWALHHLAALFGFVYSILVWQFAENFWVAYSGNGYQLDVRVSNNLGFNLYLKQGIIVAATGTFFLVVSVIFRYIDESVSPQPSTGIPEERQPVVSQAANTATYHTDA